MKKINLSKSFKSGFTLIELLVVVAIIGILASVVLASLNSARTKGSDAAIKTDLAGVRSQAEILYATYGGYGVDATPTAFTLGVCANTADTLFANGTIWSQVSHAASTSGGFRACASTANAWSVGVQMKQNTSQVWCVDSSGNSRALAFPSATQPNINALITTPANAPLCD